MKRNNELSPSPGNTYRESAATYEGSLSGVDSGLRVTGAPALQDPISERSGVHSQPVAEPIPHHDERRNQSTYYAPDDIDDEYSHHRRYDGFEVDKRLPQSLRPSLDPTWDIPITSVDFSSRVVAIAIQRKRALDEKRQALDRAKQKRARLPAEHHQNLMELEAQFERRRAELNAEYDRQQAELIREIEALTQIVTDNEDRNR